MFLLVVPPDRESWRGQCTMPPRYSAPAQSVQMGSHRFDVGRDASLVRRSLSLVSECG